MDFCAVGKKFNENILSLIKSQYTRKLEAGESSQAQQSRSFLSALSGVGEVVC